MKQACYGFLLLLQMMACGQVAAAEDTLTRIKETHQIRMGYLEGAAPFSSIGANKTPEGYSIDLCTRVAAGIQRDLGLAQLRTVWVPLGVQDRIEAVHSGRVDIECGATTWTLTRQKLVDFSLITFVDGASLLVAGDSNIRHIADAGGKRIAVVRGTTTERALMSVLTKDGVKVDLVRVDTNDRGAAMLTEGSVDGFASDRFILLNIAGSIKSSRPLRLIDEDYSVEPYALMLPRNDQDFRLAVNRSLANVFRTGDINRVYARWLSQYGKPSLLLSALYYLQAIPE